VTGKNHEADPDQRRGVEIGQFRVTVPDGLKFIRLDPSHDPWTVRH
jgi:hypothetical protein